MISAKLSRLCRDDRGATSIIFAVSVPSILGAIILMTEVGYWRVKKANLQATADMAAIAGAYEFKKNEDKLAARRAAFADALDNQFDMNLGQLTANIPPISGQYTNQDAIQITIKQEIPTFLSDIFLSEPLYTRVTSVAKLGGQSVEACVLALAGMGTGISIGGSVTVTSDGCGLHSNSTSSPSFNIWGAAEITAACASSSGVTQVSGSKPKIWNECPNPLSYQNIVVDPYAQLDVPANIENEPCQSATITGKGSKQTMTLPTPKGAPVRICDAEIDIKNTVNLEPGTYVFDGTELDFGNGGFVVGDNVTLIFMNDAKIDNVNGGNGFDIKAPNSGDYAGIAMYADRHTMTPDSWKFAGNSDMSILGALYLPTLDLEYTGGAGTNSTDCTQLVANRISFIGNSGFKNNCDPVGTGKIVGPGSSFVVLVE